MLPENWNICRFNTSHVKVNLLQVKMCNFNVDVSIHPMLKLIRMVGVVIFTLQHSFNTSHVKVNLRLLR